MYTKDAIVVLMLEPGGKETKVVPLSEAEQDLALLLQLRVNLESGTYDFCSEKGLLIGQPTSIRKDIYNRVIGVYDKNNPDQCNVMQRDGQNVVDATGLTW